MTKDHHSDIFTIGIGGAAGDGVRESGQGLGQLLCELGYEVYISNTYLSLIRGGHNFTRVSFSREKIWCDHDKLDVLIALNEETIKLHTDELYGFGKENKEGFDDNKKSLGKATVFSHGVVLADSFGISNLERLGRNAVALPMLSSIKELNSPSITRNSVALGAICYLLDLDYGVMQKILGDIFKDKLLETNIKLADIGFNHAKNLCLKHPKHLEARPRGLASKRLIDGNTAAGMGLISAGLDFYVAYPMTPVTGILHFLAAHSRDLASSAERSGLEVSKLNIEAANSNPETSSLKVIQPESELAVVNMALGMSYAGKRVAVGSATGGFMLMQEAFSMSGIAELPLAVIVGQRQAPATGVPTVSSQTDLRTTIHAGHGEFPRIVLLPGDIDEAFLLASDALNLAWKYQIPVISLMDKILCENSSTSSIDSTISNIERGKTVGALKLSALAEQTKNADTFKMNILQETAQTSSENLNYQNINNYSRYSITSDGISPMVFPGTPDAVVKVTSYEHDEKGITADEAAPVQAMIDKRFKKGEIIFREFAERETVKVYGDLKSKNVIVFWGSTKGPVLEAAKYLKSSVKLVQIIWAEPFDKNKVLNELKNAKKIINIECNHNAQMASLIREKTGIAVTDNILKYDSRPFEPIELVEEINKILEN